MKHLSQLLTSIVLLCTALLSFSACSPKHPAPVNPNATPEAKALLERLYQTVDNGQIISGLHHNQLQMPNYRRDLNRIDDASGKEPLIWGGDVAWDAAKVVEMATEQYHRGHIITLMWHAARPFDCGPVNFKEQTQGEFTDEQWQELITEGSEMHQLWIAQVDSIAQYLKVLQERQIPVIWRPLHEMNGEWFWWGNRPGPDGYQKVWRMLYDRMTNYHKLNNLLWVWNANATRETPGDRAMRLDDYYPGGDCVDILATDVYHRDWRQCHHDDLDKLANGKLIALGELGSLPTPEQLAQMPKFAWFMIWTNFAEDEYNTLDQLNAIFSLPNVITFEGTERVAQFDFVNARRSLQNEATIQPLGDQLVLSLGNGEGYYDMTAEMGRLVKSLRDFSLSVYYKVDAKNPLDGYGHFVFACSALAENGPDEGPYVAFRLNEQRFEVSTGGYMHEEFIMQGGQPERDVWHHAVYRQQEHKGEFFIDGKLIGTNENMPYLADIFTEAPANCWLGKAPFRGDKYLTDTQVADLSIFNYALTDEEVQDLSSKLRSIK